VFVFGQEGHFHNDECSGVRDERMNGSGMLILDT
jgi:hypothetical protein